MSASVSPFPSTPSSLNANPPWNNPELCSINRLRARSSFVSYASAADALAKRKAQQRSLNGMWRFQLVARPELTPAQFMQPAYKDAEWDDIAVPGCFTMQGYGRPHYTNVQMPFPEAPPMTPADNPTGLYRTEFNAAAAWLKKRVIVRFGSLESVGQIWVNGQAVGLSKDSRLPSEFDITSYLHPGKNILAVQVIQFSDASFVEDQDQWWQAGVARDVDLLIVPKTSIEDPCIYADYDAQSGSGHIDFTCRLFGLAAGGWMVSTQLIDGAGKNIGTAQKSEVYWSGGTRPHGTRVVASVASHSHDFLRIHSWNHEDPYLYTLLIELHNPQGKVIEATTLRAGFRRVEIKNRELLINGKMVLIKGVNRHEHDEHHGKVISRELMRKDVEVLKQHHVNAVRTSHYPPDSYFFDLCDEFGLYCIDEANIETHHYYNDLANDPRYLNAFVDRGSRMVLRDRSHCSIISWSLGNESGYGPNHDAMAGWIRAADPTRILHYEGAIQGDWDRGHASTDLICPMYPQVSDIVKWAQETSDPRPLIMCEFSHAMGNACGSLKEYWEAVEKHHGLQGGFIWEMLDHGIAQYTAEGEKYWAYGGDFGDTPNDANFVCDGLFWPDRTPHTAMLEAKALWQPLSVEWLSSEHNTISIHNKHDFINADVYALEWEILADGESVCTGKIKKISVAAGERSELQLALGSLTKYAGQELCVNVRFIDKRDLPLLGKNFEAASCQLLKTAAPAVVQVVPVALSAFAVHDKKQSIHISYESCAWIFDKKSGTLVSWQQDGVERIESGCQSNFWRATVDNDGLKLWNKGREGIPKSASNSSCQPIRPWLYEGFDIMQHKAQNCAVRTEGDCVRLSWSSSSTGLQKSRKIITNHRISFFADGSFVCEHDFTIPDSYPQMPRVGVSFIIPQEFKQMSWHGLGPHENYNDRQSCASIGRWQCAVSDRYVPYVMPQEHGHIADLRSLDLVNSTGTGLRVEALSHCEANVSHFSNEHIHAATHTYDLKPEPHTYLYLDAAHRGLGSGSCGPDTLMQYRVLPGDYHLSYRVSAI